MTTVKEYAGRFRTGWNKVTRRFDADLNAGPKDLRVAVMAVLTLLAVVVKVLVDKGLITDAELMAAFAAAEDEEQAREP